MINFTPVEERLLKVFSDGLPHDRDELLGCLGDTEATFQNVQNHISNLRKKLSQRGQTILCEVRSRRYYYRHIRLLVADHLA